MDHHRSLVILLLVYTIFNVLLSCYHSQGKEGWRNSWFRSSPKEREIMENIACDPNDNLSCLVAGRCNSESLLRISTTLGEDACLRFCHQIRGCNWFTYHNLSMRCETFSICNHISQSLCKDCISGSSRCKSNAEKCWAKGVCIGDHFKKIKVHHIEKCESRCKKSSNCNWFSFDVATRKCLLFNKCDHISRNCHTCSTSGKHCRGLTGSFKILIVQGLTKKVEVIDLENSSSKCQNLPQSPFSSSYIAGVLRFDEKPFICNGKKRACYILKNTVWKKTVSMPKRSDIVSMITHPNKKHPNLIILKSKNSNYVEAVNEKKWRKLPAQLPNSSLGECLINLNSTSLMLIGGANVKNVFIKNMVRPGPWVEGPQLSTERYLSACGKIRHERLSKDSESFSVIVAGGFNSLSSVEILDQEDGNWRKGPNLPIAIHSFFLIEDPLGGVVTVGGHSPLGSVDKLFRLPNADASTKWIVMEQRMSMSTYGLIAFGIPSYLTNCTIN